MTRRGDDAAERRALTDAMLRLLSRAPDVPTGTLTVSGLAKEAGYERHVLTHKHTDLRALWKAIVDLLVQSGSAEGTKKNEAIELAQALRDELAEAKQTNASLAAQLAAAILRLEELERRDRRRGGSHLRPL